MYNISRLKNLLFFSSLLFADIATPSQSENVLVNYNSWGGIQTAKLTDFGVSKTADSLFSETMSFAGTKLFMSPEALLTETAPSPYNPFLSDSTYFVITIPSLSYSFIHSFSF